MIRVLLAEDQAMVRGALSALLSLEKDIEVIAEVALSGISIAEIAAQLYCHAETGRSQPHGSGTACGAEGMVVGNHPF